MELINNIVKGLAKVFQFFLQFLAGEEDTALHGAQREVQLFSDFAVLEAGNVHSERNSIFFRERVDYPMHFFQVVRSSVFQSRCLAAGSDDKDYRSDR